MEEIWEDIETFSGSYQISNFFRVRSLDRIVKTGRYDSAYRTIKGKILKEHLFPNGYSYVKLYKNQKQKNEMMHVLIAKHFIENPHNKLCVNHKNGIKNDNRIENLEWVTHSENNRHAIDVLGKKNGKPYLGKYNELHHGSKKIKKISLDGIVLKIYPSISEAARELGSVSKKTNISEVLLGKNKTSNGFKWEYC